MTQTGNRIFDDFARLITDAAGVAEGARREVETAARVQAERVLRSLDVVSREEFEAVREIAIAARDENEKLAARIAALEARLAETAGNEATEDAVAEVRHSDASDDGAITSA
ncbi:MAG: accessory factor UbiK family protein [Pseudochelatococcus sp.]|jgi:BMFP domain-containing protein YqiC|uniref:accessory factor UbiK family protein n=1 Tax=Pseudochelatococcus sp. TaxID=2020869 RepID=UPI003D93BD71